VVNVPHTNDKFLLTTIAKRFSALTAIKFLVKKSACSVDISICISWRSRISAATGFRLPTRNVP
jgi:hypothetical protein